MKTKGGGWQTFKVNADTDKVGTVDCLDSVSVTSYISFFGNLVQAEIPGSLELPFFNPHCILRIAFQFDTCEDCLKRVYI